MSSDANLYCKQDNRRQQVIDSTNFNGIDYIEVPSTSLDAQRYIQVYFLKVDYIDDLVGRPDLVSVDGGVRITDLRVLSVVRQGDHIVVEVNQAGDFSPYTLTVYTAWMDSLFNDVVFSFKAGCPSDFDCQTKQVCPPDQYSTPVIDYLAKDYASFRQALLDLIPLRIPEWKEANPSDLGMALVELLAYAGDQLSYYQDAIANEAYLGTARQRVSVRRHARLVDYNMHDGASARAFIQFESNTSGRIPVGTPVLTRITAPLGTGVPGAVILAALQEEAQAAAHVTFETMQEVWVYPQLNKIKPYTWKNQRCCLPRGATSIDLEGDLTSYLMAGDYLLFEEIVSPQTGLKQDADPTHRQIVRLTSVTGSQDPLDSQPITQVAWDRLDALKFSLCLTAETPIGPMAISVARGNLVLADHGERVFAEEYTLLQAPPHENQRRVHRVRLKYGPLSNSIPALDDLSGIVPAARLIESDPHQAQPQVLQLKVEKDGVATDDWVPMAHLLESDDSDHHFAVEADNDGRALIRFGDNTYGAAPPDGATVTVDYRIGVGKSGNVGAEAFAHVVAPLSSLNWPDVTKVYNPLPAWGGVDPEPIAEVRRKAPAAFQADPLRAVTEADYTRLATLHPEVQRAVATFRWTGSWHTVFITIDPLGSTEVDDALQQRVRAWMTRFTQTGYDLEIDPPVYVPLEIELDVCAARDHFRGDVKEAVLYALDNRLHITGESGFFYSDNFTFGQPLYLSRLYAAVEAVEGVDSVEVKVFKRFGKLPNQEIEQGYIPMGRLEIARLDNDPSLPENGVLTLNMLGGK
jgi:hypothetical protein